MTAYLFQGCDYQDKGQWQGTGNWTNWSVWHNKLQCRNVRKKF